MKTLAWIIVFVAAAGAEPTTKPAATTTPASRPTTTQATQPAVSPAVEKALDAVEAGRLKFHSLTADVRYTEEEVTFGERTAYLGRVYYQRDPKSTRPGRFRIHFDQIVNGRKKAPEDRDYVFFSDKKGQWLITRNARIKQQVKYQVAPPGDTTDPLELGRGPFPVPFGQRKAKVLSLFDVTTRDPQSADPKGTIYLKLVPRPKATKRLKVRWIELWVKPDGLPVQIRTEDTTGETRKTALFTKIAKNPKLTDKDFDLPNPPRDWEYRIEPLPKADTSTPAGRRR